MNPPAAQARIFAIQSLPDFFDFESLFSSSSLSAFESVLESLSTVKSAIISIIFVMSPSVTLAC